MESGWKQRTFIVLYATLSLGAVTMDEIDLSLLRTYYRPPRATCKPFFFLITKY